MKLTFKNFTNLTDEEVKAVHAMRNADSIRLKMYNQDIIPFENHKKWLSGLAGRNDCIYFLVLADDMTAGCVNFTSISEEQCEWGYYLNPEIQNGGLGIVLEYYAIRYAFEVLKVQKLFGAVIDSNPKLYANHIKHFGFSEDSAYTSEKVINRQVIKFNGMSLQKSDWKRWSNPVVLKWLATFSVEIQGKTFPTEQLSD